MAKQKIIIILLSIFQLINCQDMNKEKTKVSYNVQLSHSDNKHAAQPIEDSIITLEGVKSNLPYGRSSGSWSKSGKGSTLQGGIPIGVDVIYYVRSENAFYHLIANFPKDKVLDFVQRAYAIEEPYSPKISLEKKFINRRDEPDYYKKYNDFTIAYKEFSELIFGFAPKGYVVVWFGYGPIQIELGEFQATKVTDKIKIKEYEVKYQKKYNVDPRIFDELEKEYCLPNESPEKWKQYRTNYKWVPSFASKNKGFKAFRMDLDYYNGERETILRPLIEKSVNEARALPKEISFFWETGENQAFEGAVFFDWSKTNEAFKKVSTDSKLELKIAEDNNSFEVLLNGEKLSVDSMRVYRSTFKFKDSYK